MVDRILIADYSEPRLNHLKERLRARFLDVEVFELKTNRFDETAGTDVSKLQEIKAHQFDLLIGHIGGNPSGYECLKTFKNHNPKGKAILYTKQDSIPLAQFAGLRLANAIFRRADDDSRVFANDDEVLDLIDRVRKEPALVQWTSPFADKAVLLTLIPLATALLGLIAAVAKLLADG